MKAHPPGSAPPPRPPTAQPSLLRRGLERLQQVRPHVIPDAAGDAGLDVAVDVGVRARELEPEHDVAVPALTDVLDRAARPRQRAAPRGTSPARTRELAPLRRGRARTAFL